MRAAFGLAGLLITIGVIVWIMKDAFLPHTQVVIKQGNKAKEQAAQIAGVDLDSGLKHYQSITMTDEFNNGHIESILVSDIIQDGPMAKYFGLKRNDSIIEFGTHSNMMRVRDYTDVAKEQVLMAYQEKQPLTVIRDGQQLTLPLAPVKPAPAPAPGVTAQKKSDAVDQQLDLVQKIPLH